jgi:diketogulonate reductase-like aldo/keto reductase
MQLLEGIKSDLTSNWIYGTAWKEEKTSELTLTALKHGFRVIDTANQLKHYVESAVGNALLNFFNMCSVKREDIVLQTKFTYANSQDKRLPYDNKANIADQVEQSFFSSLDHLNTNYIDSYLLHSTFNTNDIATEDLEAWQAMENLYKKGYIKRLGISNISNKQLLKIYDYAEIKPAIVQNRCYAHTSWNASVRYTCKKLGIEYQGFSILSANLRLTRNIEFKNIVQKYKLTPAQVIYQVALKMGIKPLTGACNLDHLIENVNCMKTELSNEDVKKIEKLMT